MTGDDRLQAVLMTGALFGVWWVMLGLMFPRPRR